MSGTVGDLDSPPARDVKAVVLTRSWCSPSKVFPVAVIIIAGITNVLLLDFVQRYIDDDVASLIVGIYAYASIPLCAYGLVGIIKVSQNTSINGMYIDTPMQEKPKYISVFAKYLFLDAATWAICRFLVAQIFFMSVFNEDACSIYNPKWSPENFSHDIITSVQSFRSDHVGHSAIGKRCQAQAGAMQIVVVVLLMAFTAAHGSIAMGMRQHAKEVERLQLRPESTPEGMLENEKAGLIVIAERDVV